MSTTWTPNLGYGVRGDRFGKRDYTGNLKEIWDTQQAGADRQKALMERRRQMLSWMGDNKDKMHANIGDVGGLRDMMTGGHTKGFMGQNMDINPATGTHYSDESKNWYGHADLMHSRATGASWTDILSHLDQNLGSLRDKNVKGGGGLYDEVAGYAKLESQNQWDEALSGLKDQFTTGMQEQTDQLSSAFSEGMGGVSGAIREANEATARYRDDQRSWQQRQENMQQMMIQESRRKSKEKPVMAVMPGASSYGGGGGGASAFARKKKQTTGLNIA
tara:strand:- start:132 stop:956 length:825 start_codon:yes stop_codon:yes gene_type:complete